MKFRLKVGPYFGDLNPDLNSGRSYGMLIVPWIKLARDHLGTGLKETKSLADYLRTYVEGYNCGKYLGASVIVDTSVFPFLANVPLPLRDNSIIEFIDEHGEFEPPVTCIAIPYDDNPSVRIVKDAMCELIKINRWEDVRRLAEVLMDIEDAQSV